MAVEASLQILSRTLPIPYCAKWVDDIRAFRYPNPDGSYDLHLSDIVRELRQLGWPLADEKIFDFSPVVTYIGFEWDVENKTVALPELKREKFQDRISTWLREARSVGVTRNDTEKLLGSLNHVALIHYTGRSFLPRVQQFLAAFVTESPFVKLHPSHSAISDMETWEYLLLIPRATRSLLPCPLVDPDIWVDASTNWGVAIVVGHRWRAWKFRPGWKTDQRGIGWAESVALEFAIYHLAATGHRQVTVKVRSDNTGAIGQYGKGRGRTTPTNECIRRSAEVLLRNNIRLCSEYVRSAVNRADGPSRGVGLHRDTRLPYTFSTPSALKSLLRDVI